MGIKPLKSSWINNEVKKATRKYFEPNGNKKKAYKNVWEVPKTSKQREFYNFNCLIKKTRDLPQLPKVLPLKTRKSTF